MANNFEIQKCRGISSIEQNPTIISYILHEENLEDYLIPAPGKPSSWQGVSRLVNKPMMTTLPCISQRCLTDDLLNRNYRTLQSMPLNDYLLILLSFLNWAQKTWRSVMPQKLDFSTYQLDKTLWDNYSFFNNNYMTSSSTMNSLKLSFTKIFISQLPLSQLLYRLRKSFLSLPDAGPIQRPCSPLHGVRFSRVRWASLTQLLNRKESKEFFSV